MMSFVLKFAPVAAGQNPSLSRKAINLDRAWVFATGCFDLAAVDLSSGNEPQHEADDRCNDNFFLHGLFHFLKTKEIQND